MNCPIHWQRDDLQASSGEIKLCKRQRTEDSEARREADHHWSWQVLKQQQGKVHQEHPQRVSWGWEVLSCLAALFWRTLGLPQQAFFCLHLIHWLAAPFMGDHRDTYDQSSPFTSSTLLHLLLRQQLLESKSPNSSSWKILFVGHRVSLRIIWFANLNLYVH